MLALRDCEKITSTRLFPKTFKRLGILETKGELIFARSLRHHFQHIIVICCIVGLWFVSGCTTEPIETNLLLPVDFSSIPGNMILTDIHTDKIEIRVQADPRLIEKINKENIHYPVDLYTDLEFDPAGASDSIEPGAYLIPVEEKRIPLDRSIKILSINPSYLSVQLEKKVTRTFKITVPYIGQPAKGYIALEPSTDPNEVDLTGAAPFIQSILELKTKPVDLTNINEDIKKEVPLDLENPSMFTSSDNIIVVTIPVQHQLITKTIENIPIHILNTESKVSVEPSHITISIKGPFETLSNKEVVDQIYSFIDLKDMGPGIYARHTYVNIPVDLIMTAASPQVFTVKIE